MATGGMSYCLFYYRPVFEVLVVPQSESGMAHWNGSVWENKLNCAAWRLCVKSADKGRCANVSHVIPNQIQSVGLTSNISKRKLNRFLMITFYASRTVIQRQYSYYGSKSIFSKIYILKSLLNIIITYNYKTLQKSIRGKSTQLRLQKYSNFNLMFTEGTYMFECSWNVDGQHMHTDCIHTRTLFSLHGLEDQPEQITNMKSFNSELLRSRFIFWKSFIFSLFFFKFLLCSVYFRRGNPSVQSYLNVFPFQTGSPWNGMTQIIKGN